MDSLLLPVTKIWLAGFLSGVFAHLSIWIRGEWDEYINWMVLCFAVLHHAAVLLIATQGGYNFLAASKLLAQIEACHFAGISVSILAYRLYFHPLRRFPGPISSKLSVWGRAWDIFRSGERGSVLNHNLHLKYGDIVRTGPNELSIRSSHALPLIHGTGRVTYCHKPVTYLNPVNPSSVNAERDPYNHYLHRRKWDRALDPNASLSYLPALCHCIDTLANRFRKYKGETFEANRELSLFAFDVVGSIGFGFPEGFNSMLSGEHNPALTQLISMIRIGVYMMLIPWLHAFSGMMPTFGFVTKADEVLREFVEGAVDEKLAQQSTQKKKPSVISYLMESSLDGITLSKHQIVSDGVIVTLAGADTTLSSLTHIVYRLGRHPDMQAILREELSSVMLHQGSPEDWSAISKLPYTEAFINEVLRLHPPTPSALPRQTPSEGLFIEDGTHIPGKVNITTPIYSLHRDQRYFVHPGEFIPERWIRHDVTRLSNATFKPRPELIIDKRAFLPFLRGPYRCAGMWFSYVEMKMWIANMVTKFDIALPANADVKEIDRRVNEEWRDYTMTQAAPVHIRFLERSS